MDSRLTRKTWDCNTARGEKQGKLLDIGLDNNVLDMTQKPGPQKQKRKSGIAPN